jgi:hypothetical protein
MEVLLSTDQSRAVLSRRLKLTKPDQELAEVAAELLRPVVFRTAELGDFDLDRRLNLFMGRRRWRDDDVDVWLPGPTSALVDGGEEMNEVERALQTVVKIWKAPRTWDQKCKQLAVKQLLPLKNKHWLEDGEDPLFATEFAARMELTCVSVDADGRIEFWYSAGEMFTDHDIKVRATLKDGPTDADIAG